MKVFPLTATRAAAPMLALLLTGTLFVEKTGAETREALQREIAPSTHIAVRPNIETPISITAAPDAACSLHAPGVADDGHRLVLYADSEGEVRFHANAQQESSETKEMELDCTAADGKATTFPIELTASATAPVLKEKPRTEALPKGAELKAGLTEDEARYMSDVEIAQHGFPPRPGPDSSPEGFAKWLQVVTHSHILMPGKQVGRPDISHHRPEITAGTETSGNWSGYELRNAPGTYNAVMGEWNVPRVTPLPGLETYSVVWVGLDGDGPSDLLQAGTGQNGFSSGSYVYTTYYAFTELEPNQPYVQEITSLPVGPGVPVYVEVWVGDVYGNQNNNGGYQWVYLENENTDQSYENATPLGSTKFTGSEADWIVERPWVNGSPALLADYDYAYVNQAQALSQQGAGYWYSSSGNYRLTMASGGATLSTASENSSTSILFQWYDF